MKRIIFLILSMFILSNCADPVYHFKLKSLQDNKEVYTRGYILSSASSSTEIFYYFYRSAGWQIERHTNGYVLTKAHSKDVAIVEEVNCINPRATMSWAGFTHKWVLYVPENSVIIKNEYKIDLK